MKNIITIILISLMVLNTVGCGGCGSPVEEETANTDIVVETEIEEDYADSLVEVEGGDGEEETTEVIEAEVTEEESTEETEAPEETPSLGYVLTECSPQTKYTNTNANIRATPDKSGTLVNTVSINTEFQVTATTDTGWSRIESNGVVCFIKSSLLSDTKTEVKQPSKPQSNTSQSQTQTQPSQPQASEPQQTPSQPQSQPDTSGLPAGFFDDMTTGDMPYTGTTGDDGSGGGMNLEQLYYIALVRKCQGVEVNISIPYLIILCQKYVKVWYKGDQDLFQ